LRDRAAALLAASGGARPARELAGVLLGATTGAVSEQILASILAGDPRFERRSDGWRLAEADARTATTGEIVTIAIATTGADPARHRVVSLAVVRAGPHGIVGRFDAVVRHERRPARYLLDAARLTLDDLDQAPDFADLVPELDAMIGDDDLHAYGATWVSAFLSAERARADLPPLTNNYVEIDDPGSDLVPAGRKPGLAALAGALGIAHRKPGLPIADAEVGARVVLALAERRTTGPIRRPIRAIAEDAPSDVGWPPGAEADERPRVRDESAAPPLVSRELLASVSSGPGVYLMEDAAGSILYIGKAVNLRRRLATYAGRAPALDRRLEGLAARAARVTVQETASDLEATLLEARLLARHAPTFNVARQVHSGASYIRIALSDDPPRVHLVAESAADGARYVGPLRSVRQAQQALAIARLAFPTAFGRRVPDVEARRQAVLAVAMLLGGQKDAALNALRETMRAAAASGDRESIDQARDGLRRVHDLKLEPSLLVGLGTGEPLLIVERIAIDERLRAHLVTAGRHVGSIDLDGHGWEVERDEIRDVADAIVRASVLTSTGDESAEAIYEERTLIVRWLAMSKSVVGVYRVPTQG
jgi:DNA polymerase III epsilon subunit-like protein